MEETPSTVTHSELPIAEPQWDPVRLWVAPVLEPG